MPTGSLQPGSGRRGLHLLALSSLAILQPLLDVLGRESGFLVARDATPAEIIGLVACLALLPPLALWSFERLVGRVSGAGESILHRALVAGLAGLVALPLLKRLAILAPPLDLVALAAVVIAVWIAYPRLTPLSAFLDVLALAPLVMSAFFFSRGSVAPLLAGAEALGSQPVVESRTPVVMLVFDELSLTSLLDRNGEIDAARYPSFARLAATSHWMRNATAVDWRTLQVVPAMLTGLYPEMTRRPPVASVHPRNLFALLAPHYRMNVVETHTQLHAGARERDPFGERLATLVSDLGLVYLHIVLPQRFAEELPSVTQTWKSFASPASVASIVSDHGEDRVRELRDFIASIEPGERPGLHFLHILLPHSPWQYMPEGERYAPDRFEGQAFGGWLDHEWWVVQAQQRHLLQLAFVDGLLGELLDHLEAIGIFDEALLVVTADHGVSFWPTGTYRDLAEAVHPEDVLGVPLFIKAPGQREGARHRRSFESVDLLPTLLELMEIPQPWEMDGCSVFDPACLERMEKTAFGAVEYAGEENKRFRYPADIGLREESLQRKLAQFGDGRTPGGLFRVGPHPEWIGRALASFAVAAERAGRVVLSERAAAFEVPIRVHGILELDREPAPDSQPTVVVAVKGVVQAAVPALDDGGNKLREMTGHPIKPEIYVSAMLPAEVAKNAGRSDLQLFLVDPESASDPAPRLWPLVLR